MAEAPLRRAVLAAAALSGAAGLVYETAWLRMLGPAVGSTALGVCLLLSVFMGGLALGSWRLGALADRHPAPLRLYAGLEVSLAACGLALPWLFRSAATPWAALLLAVPTALMGGTLPALMRALSGARSAGRDGAELYFANTAGAAAGVLAGGLLLVPALGVSRACAAAAAANAAAAVLGWWASLSWAAPAEGAGAPAPSSAEPTEGPAGWPVWACFAVLGAAGLAFETVWTRLLALVTGSTAQAFTLALAVFLIGTAAGSRLAARRVDGLSRRRGALGLLLVLLAGAALASTASFHALPWLYLRVISLFGDGARGPADAAAAGVVFLLPAVLMGMSFPFFTRLADRPGERGGRFGLAYAANAAGAVTGSWLAAFVLVPHWGLSGAAAAFPPLYGLLGAALMALEEDRRFRPLTPWAVMAALGAWALCPALPPELIHSGVFLYDAGLAHAARDPQRLVRQQSGRSLLYAEDGVHASVSVWRQPSGQLSLVINGKPDASTGAVDMPTQSLLGHLPLLSLRAAGRVPRRVLVVGLGSGVTAAAVLRHPVESVDVVEIEPAVARAAAYFAAANRGALADPRLRLAAGDGRGFLRAAAGGYDAIISEPSNPWIAGMSHLFTTEFFAAARDRLAPGGVLCQWLPLYAMTPEALASALETLRGAFPHVSAWRWKADLLLIASSEPARLDWDRLEGLLQDSGVAADLAPHGLAHAPDLLALRVGGREGLGVLARGAPRHTDDRPVLEYLRPRSLHDELTASVNVAGLEPAWEDSARWLAAPPDRNRWLARALLAAGRPEAAERELAGLPAADPWRAGLLRDLGELYMKEGKPAGALAVFSAAAERHGGPGASLDLARARLALGDRPGAVRDLEAFAAAAGRTERFAAALAKAGRPGGFASAYLALGLAYARRGQGGPAAEAFGRVLALEPGALGSRSQRRRDAPR